MELEEKPKRGRPPTYDASLHPEELIELMELGYLDVQVYAKWGITRETFYKWKSTHPEFSEAHQIGMPKCEAFYIRKAQERLDAGDDGGAKYFFGIVNNKFGWGKDEGRAGSVTNNYQIGSMNVLQTKSNPELLEILQQKLKTLSQYEDVKVLETRVIDVKPE